MIEAYAFLAVFAVQILVTSVLYPAWFTRYVRARARQFPAERLAQMYPGVDVMEAQQQILAKYRMMNKAIAVIGLLLLVWLFNYIRQTDWDEGPLELVITAYFMAAMMLPLALVVWLGLRFNKKYKSLVVPERKRSASLQRRGLFDFVSPFVLGVAVLGYILFVAFVIYLRQHPFPGFAGVANIAAITLVYVVNGLVVYTMLYGRNSKKMFESHAGRLQAINMAVKSSVYSCIVIVAYLSLNFSLRLLDLPSWQPFALSAFFVVCAIIASMGVMASPRPPEADEQYNY